jgi:bifunctional UDP-N-acetylglucosamine pyrophosphorylase/glucosamine-1-phosphate N-acetyltransferase
MFKATFKMPTTIESESLLRQLFHSERLYLMPDSQVVFEGEITLGSEITFSGHCHLLDSTHIENGSILTNVRLGYGNVVRAYSVLSDFVGGDRNLFGPFCFIRNNCRAANDCILGAHVETARSIFGNGVKISHRAFVGDADIGDQTIIGAGVVFCNFDGTGRQHTRVGANVTVGSGSLLVPPLTIGEGTIIAAGSTITVDVPAGAKIIQKR